MKKTLPKLIQDDRWLEPFTDAIIRRISEAEAKEKELTGGEIPSLILQPAIFILACIKQMMVG